MADGFNGTTTVCDSVAIHFSGKNPDTELYLYPNPNPGHALALNATGLVPDHCGLLIISDLTGRKVLQREFCTNGQGSVFMNLSLSSEIGTGMYFVKMYDGIRITCERLVVR
ncbi:MAG: T9SS type A sorting domain-containing protein [Flavobacteriales bacterium]|nr:T9SS type A sorting domain-containing protein [Flavobacteriales bacterium]